MAQASKRRRSSSALDYENTPPKKSSNHMVIQRNDVDKHVFNQNTLEIQINMDIIQGKSKNDAEKEHQKSEMRKYIGALRNSGGGVLIIHILSIEEAGYSNKFHLVFDEMLTLHLFEGEKFGDVFKFINLKKYFLIFIQGSSKIVTTDTNSRESIPKGINIIPGQQIFNYFPLRKLKPPEPLLRWISLGYREQFPYEESDNMQFKSYRDVKSIKKVKDRLNEDIRKYVSAFTKVQGGGSIFFGIEEQTVKTNTKPIVIGLNVEFTVNEMKDLEESCKNTMQEKMLWLTMDCTPLKSDAIKKYYKIAFHQLEENKKYVIELSVSHFEGIVFESIDGPTAWEVKEDRVHKIQLERWYSLINKDKLDKDFAKSDESNFLQRFEKMEISSSNLDTPYVYQIKRSVTDIRDSLFRMRKPMALEPEAVVRNLESKCEGKMAEALDALKCHEAFGKSRCISILDYNFSFMLKEDMDRPLQRSDDNCQFLCDIFVVGPDKLPLLLSFCKICDNHNECMLESRNHNHRIAKLLTCKLRSYNRDLVGVMSSTINVANDIKDQLDKCLQQEMLFPENDREPGKRAQQILFAFVQVVASIPSPLRNTIDHFSLQSIIKNMKNMLTLEQYEILYKDYPVTRKLLVNGIPGTGKTEIIKEAIKKLSLSGVRGEEILLVTENIPLCDVVRTETACTTLTRYELNQLWTEENEYLKRVQHVFVDDAQLMTSMKWYKQLSNLMSKTPGMFWIFYGSHGGKKFTVTETIGRDMEMFQQRKLRSIIRNTKEIAKFAMKFAFDIDYETAVPLIPHDAEGERVIVSYDDLSSEISRFRVFAREVGQCLDRYKAGHIAVLFETLKQIPSALNCQTSASREKIGSGLLYRTKNNPKLVKVPGHGDIKIVTASRNGKKDAVVVDSIRRYSSLDRLAVIVIGPKEETAYQAFTRPIAKLTVVKDKNMLYT